MKQIFLIFFTAIVLAATSYAQAAVMSDMETSIGQHHAEISGNTLGLTVDAEPLAIGKQANVEAILTRTGDGKMLGMDDLKEAHTKKFHALIIDTSLTDYHHVHPVASENGKGFQFSFTPRKPGDYRVWADVVPTSTNKQEYVIADLKGSASSTDAIDKKANTVVTVEGLTFKLSFDGPVKAGKAVMGKVTVSKDGKPFTALEPVMGTYAHIVGFGDDRKTVVHIHPMGVEPEKESDRGGPELSFHLQPTKPGFIKLFTQIRVNNTDVFAPFGLNVE